MTATELRLVENAHKEILGTINSYLHLARGVELEDEDDYDDYKDAIMNPLLKLLVLLEEKR